MVSFLTSLSPWAYLTVIAGLLLTVVIMAAAYPPAERRHRRAPLSWEPPADWFSPDEVQELLNCSPRRIKRVVGKDRVESAMRLRDDFSALAAVTSDQVLLDEHLASVFGDEQPGAMPEPLGMMVATDGIVVGIRTLTGGYSYGLFSRHREGLNEAFHAEVDVIEPEPGVLLLAVSLP